MQRGLVRGIQTSPQGFNWVMPFSQAAPLIENAEVQRIRRDGPGDDRSLLWVARIYRIAVALNQRPAKAVQDMLGLTPPNASIWIRRARDRRLLDDSPAEVSTQVFYHPGPEVMTGL